MDTTKEDIDNLVKQVDVSLKKFKKYDVKIEPIKSDIAKKSISAYNPLKYKNKLIYLLPPISISIILIIFKPNYMYETDDYNNRQLNKQKFIITVFGISLVIFLLYYFYKQNFLNINK